jgi:hypothetical protein
MEEPMDPDGTIKIIYTPDTAAGIRAMIAKLKELDSGAPLPDLPLRVPRPSNERPWHKHTLPSRKGKR